MSEQQPYDEPAFPTTAEQSPQGFATFGMSLRDYFSAGALPWFMERCEDSNGKTWKQNAAAASYEMADEMLKARSHEPQ